MVLPAPFWVVLLPALLYFASVVHSISLLPPPSGWCCGGAIISSPFGVVLLFFLGSSTTQRPKRRRGNGTTPFHRKNEQIQNRQNAMVTKFKKQKCNMIFAFRILKNAKIENAAPSGNIPKSLPPLHQKKTKTNPPAPSVDVHPCFRWCDFDIRCAHGATCPAHIDGSVAPTMYPPCVRPVPS